MPSESQLDIQLCACNRRPALLCVCDKASQIDNRVEVVILQHPQEQDRTLGSAPLAVRSLSKASIKVGLSWPSLIKMLGRQVDPQRWAILYLGSADALKLAPGRELVLLNRKGEILANQEPVLAALEGVILLDGTWSQAKALWWRNAWMLKCRRLILGPRAQSRYGQLRKEPRRDGLATIEAAGLVLARLEGRPEVESALSANFERMLAQFRDVKRSDPSLTRR